MKPGAGVTVGVWDTGVDLDHSVVIGANVTESLLQGVENEVSFPGGSYSHGTAVTSIISARPAGSPFAGVAWGANFKVFAAPLGQSTQEIASNYDWVEASKTVLESGVDVVNLSFGTPGLFVENFTADQLHAGLPELVVHAQKDVAEPTIFVWAAGNDQNGQFTKGSDNCVDGGYDATSPSPDAGAVAKVEELRGHTVVVVALGTDNKIASFSNRCGIAGAWCIAAPGVDIHGAYHGAAGRGFLDKYFSGTSFAAPMVTGGLALLKQFFRGQLSNPELVTRLFATADKSGRYGTMSTYGQGLMDLGAAVTPVGPAKVTSGRRVGDAGHGVRATRLSLGGAFGGGLSRSLAGREIAAFDTLGAPFWYDLSSLTEVNARPSPASRLRSLMAPRDSVGEPGGTRLAYGQSGRAVDIGGWRLGLFESLSSAESSVLNLAADAATVTYGARNGVEATAFASLGRSGPGDPPEFGALLAWRPSDKPFGLRAGWLGERGSLLSSTAQGAFGRLAADTAVLGLETGGRLGGWSLAADAEIGLVSPAAGDGIIGELSGVTTSAASLRFDRRISGVDSVTFSLAQPPRVERGIARLDVPVGRTKDGAVLRESIWASLVPSRRQIDAAARWQRTGVFGGELRSEAAYSHNPGHMDAEPELRLSAGWRVAF